MLKKIITALATSCTLLPGHAADLFPEENLRDIKAGDFIAALDTVGGYPVFQNDGNWKYTSGKAYTSDGGSNTVKMGTVQLEYFRTGYLLARQNIAVNTASGFNSYWGGSPCSPNHLVVRDKGRGKQDNCLTIDPLTVTMGTTPVTFLNILLTNAGSSGRYYRINLSINADLLGVRGSGVGDWTLDELKAKPYKKEAIDKLTAWAEQVQDASIKAIAYARYEDYKGAWSFVTGQPSQAAADKAAVANCEVTRIANRPNVPACEVYRITDGKRVSDTYDAPIVSAKTPG